MIKKRELFLSAIIIFIVIFLLAVSYTTLYFSDQKSFVDFFKKFFRQNQQTQDELECSSDLDCKEDERCIEGYCFKKITDSDGESGGSGGSEDSGSGSSSRGGSGSGGGSGGSSGGGGSGGDGGGSGGSGPSCGDGVCGSDEDVNNCYEDCGQCGNNFVEGPEQCDDGNTNGGDGCSSTCTIEGPVCGNNICETGEDSNSCPQDCQDESQFNGKNVILFYTDDQRWDTIDGLDTNEDGIIDDNDIVMPNVKNELINKGTNFENSFVNLALCCPSRASLLSGGLYAANSGIKTNTLPDGGATNFIDKNSMFVELQRAGYKTALIGKYLNDYERFLEEGQNDNYIPPGYDKFVMASADGDKWDNFKVIEGSSTPDSPSTGTKTQQTQYLTYFLKDKALEFIRDNANNPFVLEVTFKAPHRPATAAPGDENLFPNYNYEERGYKETDGDITDKPIWMQESANSFNSTKEQETKDLARKQLQSLVGVDRAIGEIIQELENLNLMDKTIIIYTSDNGYMLGEHYLESKQKAYEESIRVPLIVRAPTITQRTTEKLSSTNLDVAATIFDVANINKQTDGMSLLPLLINENTQWRDSVYLEGFASVGSPPIYYGIRTDKYKYIEYSDYIDANGNLISEEKEFYNLEQDPYELKNEINNLQYGDIINSLAQEINEMKGLGIKTPIDLPNLIYGRYYEVQLEAEGGKPPYIWSAYDNNLPNGLKLSSNGLLSGVVAGTVNDQIRFQIMVQDSEISAYTEQPNYYIRDFRAKRRTQQEN